MKNKILFISSYPPRECGIATYTQDLINAIKNKFDFTDKIIIAALENDLEQYDYNSDVLYKLNTDQVESFELLAEDIHANEEISLVIIQHEFGFFAKHKQAFTEFLAVLRKPIIMVFHTVLPKPEFEMLNHINTIVNVCQRIVVMTKTSASILKDQYFITAEKIEVIPHGTHLVLHEDKNELKKKYDLVGKDVLTTFGLLSTGKSIETTLYALKDIIPSHPNILFLILGKTHPTVLNREGESYRNFLISIIDKLELQKYVKFVNEFLPLSVLLEYLQLTDIYLFTSKDPNQAVSGTFSYAISTGCAIISTPIPHAREVLNNSPDCIFDFENSEMLSKAVTRLLNDKTELKRKSVNGLYTMVSSAWENTSVLYAQLFKELIEKNMDLKFIIPEINLRHIEKMTDDFGMLQFSNINQPDISSGYTLDDNARALIAVCQYYRINSDSRALYLIKTYYNFIKFCLLEDGKFLNYVNEYKQFSAQNFQTNIEDSNGRAIWALGYLAFVNKEDLPLGFINDIDDVFEQALLNIHKIHSTRTMAFAIKGLYYYNKSNVIQRNLYLIIELTDRLYNMFLHESNENWVWFESYLTYANSVLSEAMLCAYLVTNNEEYKRVAKASFDFLLSKIYKEQKISVIQNVKWLKKVEVIDYNKSGAEQPIDVAYTIMALEKFNEVFPDEGYDKIINSSFNWFLGNNHLKQTIYNPCTAGCYDGLERNNVNLNQGAESTISYLLSRLVVERSRNSTVKEFVH